MKAGANVLILTSTYPRWARDATPGFVADFASHIAPRVSRVYVLAPHYQGAAVHEMTDGVHVTRYRYFSPPAGEDIFYNGGAITRVKKTPLYALKLLCFMTSLFFHTLFYTLTRRITIINAHWLLPQGLVGVLVKFITGRTLAITIHGGDVLSLNGTYVRKLKRFILRHADLVYVNSSVTKGICQKLYQRDYILIPMGINIAHFQSAKPSKKLVRQYNLGNFTILFVGRMVEAKGIIYLLEALNLMKLAGKECRALLVGNGPLARELRTYIDSHNLRASVHMIGWVDNNELATYYKTVDIFVAPSLYEAQGIVFVEALAAGLPVITTNQGGMKDFVKDGTNGLLVPVKSSQALYDALVKLYDDRRLLKKLALQASPSITQRYSWDKVADDYVASWKDLLS